MKGLDTKILVCCHKNDIMAVQKPYFPIQLGKAITDINLGITADDTGDNISYKNQSFCELTGLYWAWKNLKDIDIIGLCHYRRYFDFHGICEIFKPYTTLPSSYFPNVNLSIPDHIIEDVNNGTIIIPRKENYPMSVISHYNNGHSSFDMYIMKDIIKKDFDDSYSKAFWKALVLSNKMSICNMFIMNWENFNSYCSWLFYILEKAEKRIDITNYSPYQKRIYGFLAERLFNVWICAERKKTKEYPLLFFSDEKSYMSSVSPWKYGLGCYINNILNLTRRAEYRFNLTNLI